MRLDRILLALVAITAASCCDHHKPDEPKPEEPKVLEVDLGLSVVWSDRNVGAAAPDSVGVYVAWGETKEKEDYALATYRFYSPVNGGLYFDYKGGDILKAENDAASVVWGSDWRMPTKEECQELLDKCTWTWISEEGRSGYTVAGPGGGSIFLPAAGSREGTALSGLGSLGAYWSASLGSGLEENAWAVSFSQNNHSLIYIERPSGFQIRGVKSL
jgi:hypothetical protein